MPVHRPIDFRQCLWFFLLNAWAGYVPIYGADALTPIELQGRQIYQQGLDGSQDAIEVTLGLTHTTLSAQTFTCINCHGVEGEGKVEGSLQIPAIQAKQLFKPVADTRRARGAYDVDHLARAIAAGQNADAQLLDDAMPRYHLTPLQMAALIAYLKRLGSEADLDPGINTESIQLGSVLPLSGKMQATGQLLKNTLEACVADANAQGLIYGRRLAMTVEDSGSTSEGALKAKRRLLSSNKTFVLLAPFSPDNQPESSELLPAPTIPEIFPITFSTQSKVDSLMLYALPSYQDQARALVDYWVGIQEVSGLKASRAMAIIAGEREIEKQIVQTIRSKAMIKGLTIIDVVYRQVGKSTAALKRMMNKKPAAILFLGDMLELKAVNELLVSHHQKPVLLSLLAMLGPEAIQFDSWRFAGVFLATPFAYDDDTIKQFSQRLQHYGVALKSLGLQSVTCGSVAILVESLKQTGKHLSRQKLFSALDKLHNFPINFMPPLSFTNKNRVGLSGAYVLGISRQGEVISQSAWIRPAE